MTPPGARQAAARLQSFSVDAAVWHLVVAGGTAREAAEGREHPATMTFNDYCSEAQRLMKQSFGDEMDEVMGGCQRPQCVTTGIPLPVHTEDPNALPLW